MDSLNIDPDSSVRKILDSLRAQKFSDVIYSRSDWIEATFEFPNIKEHRFKTYTRPGLKTYIKTYVAFITNHINNCTINDAFLIAIDIQNKDNQHIINLEIDSVNGEFDAVASDVSGVPDYDYDEILKYAKAIKSNLVDLTIKFDTTLEDFQLFMQHFCFLIVRFLYKNGDRITEKTNFVQEGINILQVKYNGQNTYIYLSSECIKLIRKTCETHMWKPMISVAIIDAFYRAKSSGNTLVSAYMSWAIMSTTHLLNFGLAKLIIDCTKLLKIDLERFEKITSSEMTRDDLARNIPVCRKILETPNATNLEHWIYFKWSGMIDQNFNVGLRYRANSFLTSLCIGIIDGTNTDGKKAKFISFPAPMYKRSYYKWGLIIARKSVKTE